MAESPADARGDIDLTAMRAIGTPPGSRCDAVAESPKPDEKELRAFVHSAFHECRAPDAQRYYGRTAGTLVVLEVAPDGRMHNVVVLNVTPANGPLSDENRACIEARLRAASPCPFGASQPVRVDL